MNKKASKSIQIGLACLTAFNTVGALGAQADQNVNDLLLTENSAPSKYVEIIQSEIQKIGDTHCLKASDLQHGKNAGYTEEQNFLVDISDRLSPSPTASIILEKNERSDLSICVSYNPETSFGSVGFFNSDNNTVFLNLSDQSNLEKIDFWSSVAAEEFSHAYQYNRLTNHEQILYEETKIEHYDSFLFGVGTEAQAKIWTAAITHELESAGQPLTEIAHESEGLETTYASARECLKDEKNSHGQKQCLKDAFQEISTVRNIYTDRHGLLTNNATGNRYNITSDTYNRLLGQFPDGSSYDAYLDQSYDYNDFSLQRPPKELFRPWQMKILFKEKDGDIKLGSKSATHIHTVKKLNI